MRSVRNWLALVFVALAPALARAQVTFDGDYAAFKSEFGPKVAAFAEWCANVKLYLERDRAYEALLRLDPAHEAAHKALKHTKQKDGTWVVPEKRGEVKNYGASLKEGAKRRSELSAEFRTKALQLLEAHKATVTSAQRESLLADLLALDSEVPETRALCGEVKRGDAWVLTESEGARERRAALKELIAAATRAVAEPHGIEPKSAEQALSITWTALVATPSVRVLSSGALDEARKVAIQCTVAAAVFKQLTGATQDLPPEFTVYLMPTAAARDSFITKWPGWSDEERTRLRTWAGSGVPGDVHIGRWDADAPRRLDGAVRHVIGVLTLLNFGFDHQSCAWAFEGVGLYLTRELVGTRFTWYSSSPTSGDPDTKELLGKLMMTDVDWMNECYQRLKRNKGVKIAALCERKVDQFGVDEILTSYGLAAYLIEGRPNELGAVLKRIAAEGSARALAGGLEVELERLDARLVRWLGERK